MHQELMLEELPITLSDPANARTFKQLLISPQSIF